MSLGKYFPVPSKKKTKKSYQDETLIIPLLRSYKKYYHSDSNLPSGVPEGFLPSSTPSVLTGVPTRFTTPAEDPITRIVQQQQRSQTTIQSLLGQQETIQEQLDITNVGSMESLKAFISMYSNEIRPELREQYFGRTGSVPVSAISRGLQGMTTGEKRALLTGLVAEHNLAQDFLAFHQEHLTIKRIKKEVAESSSMAQARERTTRHERARQQVHIGGAHDNMNRYVNARDILDAPDAYVNPLFTGGDSGDVETE